VSEITAGIYSFSEKSFLKEKTAQWFRELLPPVFSTERIFLYLSQCE
jgi:hypothetical protein